MIGAMNAARSAQSRPVVDFLIAGASVVHCGLRAKAADAETDLVGERAVVRRSAKGRRAEGSMRVPGKVLAKSAHRCAVVSDEGNLALEMRKNGGAALLQGGRRAAGELPENPGIAQRGAANHHEIAAG